MSLSDVIDAQISEIERLRRAVNEAHFLLCWTFQDQIVKDPPMKDGQAHWRVWYLHPGVRANMNSGQQSLYDALMKLQDEPKQ